ncbi:MAG: glycerol-3-phosphate 1-O-acyltransferase PlsB [Proteobacteria bacterium]|nr:glycerol-3-phosphate 1-O-acyltransferase PlsB [Pseudomonadota bacterium]
MRLPAISRFFLYLRRKIQRLILRCKVVPDDLAELQLRTDIPVCYVLEYSGRGNRMALDEACRRHGLPDAENGLELTDVSERRAIFYLKHYHGWYRRRSLHISDRLRRLVETASQNPDMEIQIVPASIFWGRAPEQRSGLKLLFSEQWKEGGRWRRLMQVLLQGRETLVHFSAPLSLRDVVDEELGPKKTERKIARILRVHFRRLRAATIGPDLSHRRILFNSILRTSEVRAAIQKEISSNKQSEKRVKARSRSYLKEISADYSYPVVKTLAAIFSRVWNRLYDGVDLANVENLRQIAPDYELVYVPCHRSHIDYLLLSYVIYNQGLMVPHVAAGKNLDLPIIGSILRSGGAFFLRRSFKGKRLYSVVFESYLSAIIERGYSIEYFVEGGRSRTGRLLKAKPGMLAMTVRSFLKNSTRPIAFVPVYFGYEKLVEGQAFIRELRGGTKRKESFFGFLGYLPSLRNSFGKVAVNFGQPLILHELLDELRGDWREDEDSSKWLPQFVSELGDRIMLRINEAASVSPAALLSVVLLSTQRQTMLENDLREQMEMLVQLLSAAPYSPWMSVTQKTVDEIIAHGEELDIIIREERELGAVVRMRTRNAVLMTYVRNSIQHLLILPSLIAACFTNRPQLRESELVRLCGLVYPFLQVELFLRWRVEELAVEVPKILRTMRDLGLVKEDDANGFFCRPDTGAPQAAQINFLARTSSQALERFYMAIAVLLSRGSGQINAAELEEASRRVAQHMALLYELDSPDYFDRSLFRSFVSGMLAKKFLRENSDGMLVFDETLENVDQDARLVLSEQVRLSILQLASRLPDEQEPNTAK